MFLIANSIQYCSLNKATDSFVYKSLPILDSCAIFGLDKTCPTDSFVCSGIPSTMGFAMTQAPHMGTKNWTRVKVFSLMWVCKSENDSIPLVDRRRWRSWMARKLATRRMSSPHKMIGMILVGMDDSVSERLVDISILQQKLAVCTASQSSLEDEPLLLL